MIENGQGNQYTSTNFVRTFIKKGGFHICIIIIQHNIMMIINMKWKPRRLPTKLYSQHSTLFFVSAGPATNWVRLPLNA